MAGVESRRNRRYDMSLPVVVQAKGRSATPVETSTRDVSAGGLYFTFAEPLEPGSELECEVLLPAAFGYKEAVRVRCRGKVVRVERPEKAGRIGVAGTIERYEFVKVGKLGISETARAG